MTRQGAEVMIKNLANAKIQKAKRARKSTRETEEEYPSQYTDTTSHHLLATEALGNGKARQKGSGLKAIQNDCEEEERKSRSTGGKYRC